MYSRRFLKQFFVQQSTKYLVLYHGYVKLCYFYSIHKNVIYFAIVFCHYSIYWQLYYS